MHGRACPRMDDSFAEHTDVVAGRNRIVSRSYQTGMSIRVYEITFLPDGLWDFRKKMDLANLRKSTVMVS